MANCCHNGGIVESLKEIVGSSVVGPENYSEKIQEWLAKNKTTRPMATCFTACQNTDATEAEGSKQSRTEKKKKKMPRMEKKLSRTENMSQKDAIEGLKLELLNLEAPLLEEDTKKPKKSIIHSKPSTSKRPPWR
ncbi:hypothetical protein P8452_22418 [Trifolium repens]|nr:hypothetical protein P8452_22418 [Trifolium repens]